MNIVYTINGEGMGHATRSSVVLDHVLAKGHRLRIFSSGRKPLQYLREKYGDVAQVTGLHMVYRDNAVKRLHTALRILVAAPEIRRDIATIRAALAAFKPDVVITDFDFHGQIAARQAHVPVISVDNIQALRFADVPVAPADFIDYEINVLVAKMMVPRADYFLITSFAKPSLKDAALSQHVYFVPPLFRKAVQVARPTVGEHILVYQTADSYADLLPVLAQSGGRFIIYNCRKQVAGLKLSYREFNEQRFIEDLASAKAVITNGGFNVIAESLYFGKPVLSIPIRHFYEQRMNGDLVQGQGCGVSLKRITRRSLAEFISNLPRFQSAARALQFDADGALKKLDEVLSSISRAPFR